VRQVGQHLVAADVEGAEHHRLAVGLVQHRLVGLRLPVHARQAVREHEHELGAEKSNAVAAGFLDMRHVRQQAGVDLQRDLLAVPGGGGQVAQGLVVLLAPRAEAHLVRVGGNDLRGRADVHLADDAIDDDRIPGCHALDDSFRLAHRRDPERLGDDGDVALPASVLDHEAAQFGAVVIDQLRRSHGPRDQNGVGRHLL